MANKPIELVPATQRRVSTGRDPAVGFRLTRETIKALDEWVVRNNMASRSEALRVLVERGLKDGNDRETTG